MKRVALIVAAMVLFGCGSDAPGSLDNDYAREVLSDLSSIEQAGLEDFVVTYGEYDAGVMVGRECLASAGFQVDPIDIAPNGIITFTYGVEGFDSDEELESLELKAADCFKLYDALEVVYAYQNVPSESERQNGIDALADCARSLGIDVGQDPSADRTLEAIYDAGVAEQITIDQGRTCIDPFQVFTIEPVPGIEEALRNLSD